MKGLCPGGGCIHKPEDADEDDIAHGGIEEMEEDEDEDGGAGGKRKGGKDGKGKGKGKGAAAAKEEEKSGPKKHKRVSACVDAWEMGPCVVAVLPGRAMPLFLNAGAPYPP